MIPCLLAANGNAAALLSRLHHASSACSLTSHHTCDTTLRHDNQAQLTYWERLAQRPGQPHVQGPPLQSRSPVQAVQCSPGTSASPRKTLCVHTIHINQPSKKHTCLARKCMACNDASLAGCQLPPIPGGARVPACTALTRPHHPAACVNGSMRSDTAGSQQDSGCHSLIEYVSRRQCNRSSLQRRTIVQGSSRDKDWYCAAAGGSSTQAALPVMTTKERNPYPVFECAAAGSSSSTKAAAHQAALKADTHLTVHPFSQALLYLHAHRLNSHSRLLLAFVIIPIAHRRRVWPKSLHTHPYICIRHPPKDKTYVLKRTRHTKRMVQSTHGDMTNCWFTMLLHGC
jgi:hypothetical protein